MIYDCFLFFNELDLLEIRLNILNDIVDKFVITESTRTFSNEPKPLYFQENKERFSQFLDKIIYIVTDENNLPEFDCAWAYEHFQRNYLINGLKDCKDDDVIILSDLDEIPKPELITKYKDNEDIQSFDLRHYNFFINYVNKKEKFWTIGPKLLHYKDVNGILLNDIRLGEYEHIPDAGWHFSYLGGIKKVKSKIKSAAHQEYNTPYYMKEGRLQSLINKGEDIFERGFLFFAVKVDGSFPLYIRKNKKRFSNLIIKTSFIRRSKKRIKNFLKRFKLKIDNYNNLKSFETLDFISYKATTIIEIGNSEEYKKEAKKIFPNAEYKQIKLSEVDTIPDKSADCIVFNENFDKIINIDEFLEKIKAKMTLNGYIIAKIPNFRYLGTLKEFFIKKRLQRLAIPYTRKNIESAFHQHRYYFTAFKGLHSIKNPLFYLLNILTINGIYDCRHKEYLIVAKH